MVEEVRKPASRSRADLEPGQQIYTVIEYCNDAETLWAKIESGHWDWLGVAVDKSDRRTFILGSPAAGGSGMMAGGTVVPQGVANGAFRVEARRAHPWFKQWGQSWHASPEEAAAAYETQLEAVRTQPGSGVDRVRLVIDDRVQREDLVVRTLPNVL